MHIHDVVDDEMKRDGVGKALDLLAEGVGQASEAALCLDGFTRSTCDVEAGPRSGARSAIANVLPITLFGL